MARSDRSRETRIVVQQRYYWPDQQLNFWIIIMLATAGTILGIFADFIMVQNQLRVGIPWYVTPSFFLNDPARGSPRSERRGRL